jgi:hypothetical protein
MNKICKACGQTKLTVDFSRHPTTKDGLQPVCKACSIAKLRDAPKPVRPEREQQRVNALGPSFRPASMDYVVRFGTGTAELKRWRVYLAMMERWEKAQRMAGNLDPAETMRLHIAHCKTNAVAPREIEIRTWEWPYICAALLRHDSEKAKRVGTQLYYWIRRVRR